MRSQYFKSLKQINWIFYIQPLDKNLSSCCTLKQDRLGVCPKIRRLWVRVTPRTKTLWLGDLKKTSWVEVKTKCGIKACLISSLSIYLQCSYKSIWYNSTCILQETEFYIEKGVSFSSVPALVHHYRRNDLPSPPNTRLSEPYDASPVYENHGIWRHLHSIWAELWLILLNNACFSKDIQRHEQYSSTLG